jgi:wyosine [tRNA(Phe)-imidazoG37] synthetase (radical SAM superfamily)
LRSTYVGLPKIAQSNMNGAELFMISQQVLDPTPNSVRLDMVNKAISHTIFTPTLDTFDADLFLENTLPNYKAFGTITIPGMHVMKEINTTINQVMQIKDQDQFNAYNTLVSQSETFKVAMKGTTKLHLGALPVVSVVFSKVITMKGTSSTISSTPI